jgi:TRAP-type C4-dicarboxylate transport system substrate-binding protein
LEFQTNKERAMKKSFVPFVIVLSLVVFLATGKISNAQTTKPIDLKLSHFMAPMHNLHVDVFAPYAKEVEEKTKGKVKITIYPGEALGKAKDQVDMVKTGVTDMAFIIHGYTAGRFPLSSVIELPFLVPSAKTGSRVLWELHEKNYLTQEYAGMKVLSLWVHGPGHVHMANKPVRTLEDIKGLRLRSPGPMQTNLLRDLGASPLTIPIPELYQAVQRGMADGCVAPFSVIIDFKLYELIKHHTTANMYVMTMALAINPKVFDSLPADVQKVMTDLAGARMSEIAGASYDKYDQLGMEAGKKAGAKFYTLTPEEQKKWMEKAKPVTDKWLADVEAKGLPGKKIYDETKQLLGKTK